MPRRQPDAVALAALRPRCTLPIRSAAARAAGLGRDAGHRLDRQRRRRRRSEPPRSASASGPRSRPGGASPRGCRGRSPGSAARQSACGPGVRQAQRAGRRPPAPRPSRCGRLVGEDGHAAQPRGAQHRLAEVVLVDDVAARAAALGCRTQISALSSNFSSGWALAAVEDEAVALLGDVAGHRRGGVKLVARRRQRTGARAGSRRRGDRPARSAPCDQPPRARRRTLSDAMKARGPRPP